MSRTRASLVQAPPAGHLAAQSVGRNAWPHCVSCRTPCASPPLPLQHDGPLESGSRYTRDGYANMRDIPPSNVAGTEEFTAQTGLSPRDQPPRRGKSGVARWARQKNIFSTHSNSVYLLCSTLPPFLPPSLESFATQLVGLIATGDFPGVPEIESRAREEGCRDVTS